MPEINDKEQEIVGRVLGGDGRAVRRLYKWLYPKLKQTFRQKVTTTADLDELIQDTFLHLLDALPLYRFQSNLSTFASSIARHELADYWRKRYAKRIIRTVPMVKNISAPLYTSMVVSKRMRRAVEEAYGKLEPIQAQMLRWKYEEERSVNEMAKLLGLTAKAVEAHLYRARKSFREVYVPVESY